MCGTAIKLEDAPGDRISRTRELCDGAARVLIDRASPKGERSGVSFRHADGPTAGIAIPGHKGGFPADSRTAVASRHEEFGDVVDVRIFGDRRAERDQHKAEDAIAPLDEERKTALGLGPVECQWGITEATVGAQVDGKHVAEIVTVELEQVREHSGFA